MAKIKDEKGITLMELLIALLLTFIVGSAALEFYVSQHNQWLVQEQISDMQQNARATMNELATNIRMAGYGMPQGVQYIYGADTNPDTITIVLSRGPGCDVTIEHAMPQPSAELRCDGHDLSCFNDDEWAYIFDPNTNTGEFFYITHVQYAASHIQHNTMPLSKSYPKGSYVISMDLIKYYIDNTTDPTHPAFMRIKNFGTPEEYAEDIEELQFVYTLSDGTTTNSPAAGDVVKSVEFTLRAKTARADEDFLGNSGFRKRTLASQVFIRNSS
ncbi:MAG: PilW family protein [Candidatus Zixiibacteriota bacterium]